MHLFKLILQFYRLVSIDIHNFYKIFALYVAL